VPCTFTDIYNADVVGAWGVVTCQAVNQFAFACRLVIGDGVNATWVADTAKQIIFVDGASPAYNNPIIEVTVNATFRLGELLHAATYSTSNGCVITSLDATADQRFIYTANNATSLLKLYSSTVLAPSARHWLGNNAGQLSGELYNCLFAHNVILSAPRSTTTFYNVQVVDYGDNYAIQLPTGTYNTMLFSDGTYGFGVWWTTANYTLQNTVFRDLTYIGTVTQYGTGFIYLIDCESDSWTWNFPSATFTSRVYRQYTIHLHVVDAAGANVSGATVIWYHADDTEAFHVTTAADGTITEQTVSRGYYDYTNGDTLQDYGPFTLTVTKAGYMPYIHENITLDEPVDWRIYLRTQLTGDAAVEDVQGGKTFYADDADTQLTGAKQDRVHRARVVRDTACEERERALLTILKNHYTNKQQLRHKL
jgi:hypothetical protein